MIGLFEVSKRVQEFCKSQNWKFCIIGGIALQRWGEPRVTQDVDISLLTGFGGEEKFVNLFVSEFEPRIENASDFALENRVLLLKDKSGVGIDVAFAGFPYEEQVISRASYYEFLPNLNLLTCSAEDLVVLKSFAARARDWADVESVVVRQEGKLDWSYIEKNLEPLVLLKEEPEILDKLRSLKNS